MHEYAIVGALMQQVEREAAARGAHRVRSLRVEIGELSGVDTELLSTAFETFRPGTICDGADLSIDAIEAVWACPTCDAPIAVGAPLRCACCETPARLRRGDEITLRQIDMEVPDV